MVLKADLLIDLLYGSSDLAVTDRQCNIHFVSAGQ